MEKSPKYFLEKLMSLPHRGNNTPECLKAAEIIFKEYEKMGLQPQYVEFKSAAGGFISSSVAMLFFLICALLVWFNKNFIALFFYILGWILYTGIPPLWDSILIKIKPFKAKSVFAQIVPAKETKKTFVFCGHFDTPPATGGMNILKLINKTFLGKKLFSNNERIPFFLRGPLFLVNLTIIILGLFFLISPHTPGGFLLFSIIFLLLITSLIVNFQATVSPPVPGAFDNGSGTATVMALAAALINTPLQNSRLIFLNNPCEEGCVDGFLPFFEKANIDKKKTYFIVLDGVGAKNLKIAYGEIGNAIGLVRYFDKTLYENAARFIKNEKKFQLIQESFLPLQSDASNIIKRGGKVGFVLFSVNDDGFVDHYHQMSDTIDKIDFDTLNLCRDFLGELIKKIDTA